MKGWANDDCAADSLNAIRLLRTGVEGEVHGDDIGNFDGELDGDWLSTVSGLRDRRVFEGGARLLVRFGCGGLRNGAAGMDAGDKTADKESLAVAVKVCCNANGGAGFSADVLGEKQIAIESLGQRMLLVLGAEGVAVFRLCEDKVVFAEGLGD